MTSPDDLSRIADQFSLIANQFCVVVDSAPSLDKTEFIAKIYRTLPALIAQAVNLPDVSRDDDDPLQESSSAGFQLKGALEPSEQKKLDPLLKEYLGDWDHYHKVFDPITDSEAIFGTLADDIADIYHDLKDGLIFAETQQGLPDEDAIWAWRFSFYSHWGKHAIDALHAIHFRLQNSAS